MSSNAYCAELQSDPTLRRLVSWSGGAVVAAGSLACAYLPAPPWACLAVALAWTAGSGLEMHRLRQSWRGCAALRFAGDGALSVRGADGAWRPAALLAGSILLQRVAWIRIRTESGRTFAEPLRGHCRRSRDWRRLQVIWRHVGAPRGSC